MAGNQAGVVHNLTSRVVTDMVQIGGCYLDCQSAAKLGGCMGKRLLPAARIEPWVRELLGGSS